VLYS
jgi:hypothetical protein